jgi:putative methyltransferase
MSRIHIDAAKVVETVITGKKGLRSAFYKGVKDGKVDTKVYALAAKTVKLQNQLIPAFEQLFEPETLTNKYLGMVIAAELLCGKISKSGGKVRKLVEAKLSDLQRLVNPNVAAEISEEPPRFLRFTGNLETLKTEIQKRLETSTDIFRATDLPDVVEFVDGKTLGALMRDEHLNGLVSKSSEFFLQDKSTCLTPHVLLHGRDERKAVHVLDVCSSPGSKALHIFSRLRAGDSLTLVERDKRRFKDLQKRLVNTIGLKAEATHGVINGVKLKLLNMDFVNFKSPTVTYINLDPSCSGSGLHTHHNRVVKDTERLEKLADMQKILLKHACNEKNFSAAQVVCYSTCSVFEEENEQVVNDGVKGFDVDSAAPTFVDAFRKGKFFQVTPEKHGCRGFFLAKFRRPVAKKQIKLAKR